MTGSEFADSLRDARLLSGDGRYAWVRGWNPARGIPFCTAVEEAALAAEGNGLLPLWFRALAQTTRGRYTIRAAEFALAADEAAQQMRRWDARVLPTAVRAARDAGTFSAWSAAVYARALCEAAAPNAQELIFMPWFEAMYARYTRQQESIWN